MESNKLVYNVARTINKGKELLTAKIELSDDCKNGHQDFSVTGEIYVAGKPRTDRNLITCGAIGDTVKQYCPDLAIFCDLHLCDYAGVPMHGISNMFFHMKNKFNSGHSIDSEEHKAKFCEHYRVTPDQFDKLKSTDSEIHFALILDSLEIPAQWKKQADQAIEKLEKLTGVKFLNDSARSNLRMPTQEQIESERLKIESGYYTEPEIRKRIIQADKKYRNGLVKDANNKKAKIDLELAVKLAIFDACGKRANENAIFYNHTRTVKLNWRQYGEELTESEIQEIKNKTKLPYGVSFE